MWSRPGNYCENHHCVVLGLYDRFITHFKSRGFEPDVPWAKKRGGKREILQNAVPRSTRSVNKWAMKIFGEWQAGRTNKKACEEESGSAVETSQIDGLTLKGILWVIRARFQGNKAAKWTFFFIFLFWVLLSRRNFYCKRRNPLSAFDSVSESIELGISLLVRVTEMLLFVALADLIKTFDFNRYSA